MRLSLFMFANIHFVTKSGYAVICDITGSEVLTFQKSGENSIIVCFRVWELAFFRKLK